MPSLSSQDKATDAISYLISIILNPGPTTPFLEYHPKATTAVEQLAENFRTNSAPEQQNPSPPSEQDTATPIATPTEQNILPTTTDYAAPRVPEQPGSQLGGNTPEAPRVLEQ